ncbi:Putative flagella-related protein H [Candidatus Methanoperedenaceae archaeon GB50]|nr:Putative flagella-related protein H [Candidatus Methanoperedenaceae archaeon GB37]CAD7770199.1 Putative flagella-related protein H [Candidatus Methanoperedenaceae archaeon GB50]
MDVLSFELDRDEFNQRLGGGFPKGSLVLFEGGNGSGKSSICQRIAYGLLKNDHTVTFISTTLSTKGFISQMYSMDYPIGLHLLRDELLYIPVLPLIKSSKSRSDFIERLMGAKPLFGKEVIIIDALSSLIKQSADLKKVINLISFFRKITGHGKVIIFTIDPSELDEDVISEFTSDADIYCTLKVRTLGNDIKRSIIVNRFTGAKSPVGGIIGFRIEPHVGLVVEIASIS